MSVLIKGMKMPTECARFKDGEFVHCPFVNTDDDCILQSKVTGTWKEMYRGCPLVALPDTHGDLIDKGEFKKNLDYYIREAGWSDEHNEALTWVKDDLIDAEMTIVEAEDES